MGSNEKTISYNGSMVQAPLPRLLRFVQGADEHHVLQTYLEKNFVWIGSTDHPDVHWLNDPDTALSIDDVRKLQQLLTYKPYQADQTIVIMQHIENASLAAQNALLKTLEEPPSYASLILTTTHVSSIIPTVVSRCQIVNLETPSTDSSSQPNTLTSELPSLTYSQLIELAERYSDRIQAETFLNALTHQLQGDLQTHPSEALMKIILIFTQAQTYVRQNLNVRLVLENALFQAKPWWPQTQRDRS